MNADDRTLLRYVDHGGIARGLHLDDGTGMALCGRIGKTIYRGIPGTYEPHVLVTGNRETLGEWRQRMGQTVSICSRCKARA